MKFTTAITALLFGAVSQLVSAAPVDQMQQARDVWTPKMLYPNSATVWKSGERHNVTWETADQPKQITGPTSSFILLRSGNYETPVLLAWDIDSRKGRVEVTVPNVITGNFSLVFFGDSGNWGDTFTIEGPLTL